MDEAKKITDELNGVVERLLINVSGESYGDDENMRVAWTHATNAAHEIALAALETGNKLKSISISVVDTGGDLELKYEIAELSINMVSIDGTISI